MVCWTALLLTTIAGLSTTLGGLVAVRLPISKAALGTMLAASAGLMLFIAFVDLWPPSLERLGLAATGFWCFAGAAGFALVAHLVPEPSFVTVVHGGGEEEEERSETRSVELLERGGMAAAAADGGEVEMLKEDASKADVAEDRRRILASAFITALGLSIHNAPEGVGVLVSTYAGGVHGGVGVAFAIALHNIGEGLAISLPIYYATGNALQAVKYSLLSGLAEPFGCLFVDLFIGSEHMDLAAVNAAVAGIMIFVSLDELYPQALVHTTKSNAVLGMALGMVTMWLSMLLIDAVMAA